jgi:hypothetical protein
MRGRETARPSLDRRYGGKIDNFGVQTGVAPLRETGKTMVAQGSTTLKIFLSGLLGLMIGAASASAEVEQCRFIQPKPEREACYQRQEMALAAKRKPEPTFDTKPMESLQQMRRDDDEVYKSLRSICRGC